MKKHIVIAGQRNTGKSEIIQRLITDHALAACGFYTEADDPGSDGYHPIYIYDAGSCDRNRSETNLVGKCNGRNRTVHSEVFDELGVRYLNNCMEDVIVMDELGFMEENSHKFCNRVLELFDGDRPILAAAKESHPGAFLDKIRNHEKACIFYLNNENKEIIYNEISSTLESIIRSESKKGDQQ